MTPAQGRASGDDRPKVERAVGDALEQAGHLGVALGLLFLYRVLPMHKEPSEWAPDPDTQSSSDG